MKPELKDLSKLPTPDIVEVLDYETILERIQAELTAESPLQLKGFPSVLPQK